MRPLLKGGTETNVIHKVEIPGHAGAVELAEAHGGKVRVTVRKGIELSVLLTAEAFAALRDES